MAGTAASQPGRTDSYRARALLWWATILERTIAGKASREAHKKRRDRAIRASHARGATLDEIVAQTRLRPNTVRAILRDETTAE
jgi:hypothetical protein